MKKELKSHKWNFLYIIETIWPQPWLKSPKTRLLFTSVFLSSKQRMHTSYVAGFMMSCTYQSKSRQIQLFNTILDKLDLLLVSINLDFMQELWITLARWSPLQSGCLGKICLDKLHPFEDTTWVTSNYNCDPHHHLMFANLIMPWILLPRCKISIPGQHNIKFTLLI